MKHVSIDGQEYNEEAVRSFVAKVRVTDDGHWVWAGAPGGFRDGTYTAPDGKQYRARRFSYAAANGHLRKGQQVAITCGRDGCICPDHLQLSVLSEVMEEYQTVAERYLGA